MAHATVMKDFVAARGAPLDSVFHIESENRRQLFHRQREVASDSANISDNAARSRRHADAGHARNLFH
jgi:hypothetical protein